MNCFQLFAFNFKNVSNLPQNLCNGPATPAAHLVVHVVPRGLLSRPLPGPATGHLTDNLHLEGAGCALPVGVQAGHHSLNGFPNKSVKMCEIKYSPHFVNGFVSTFA